METIVYGEHLLQEADLLLEANKYREAIEKFLGAYYVSHLANKKDYQQKALYKIGCCYYWLSEYILAEKYFDKIIDIIDDLDFQIKVFNMKCLTKLELRKYEVCHQYCNQLIAINTREALYKAYLTLGLIEYYQQDFDNAIRYFNLALGDAEISEYGWIYLNLAHAYISKMDQDNAISNIELALKYSRIPHKIGEVLNTYGEILISINDLERAENILLLAKTQEQTLFGLARIELSLARLYFKRKEYILAEEKLNSLRFIADRGVIREAAKVYYDLYCLNEEIDSERAKQCYVQFRIFQNRLEMEVEKYKGLEKGNCKRCFRSVQ